MVLAGGNSHSGGSVISGGSVVLDGRGALGIGDVSLKGGKLDLGGHQLDVSGTLTLAGGSLVYRGERLVVRATEGVVFEGGTTIDVSQGECQHGLTLADFGEATRGYAEGCLTLVGAGADWKLSFDETSGLLTLLNTVLPTVDDSVRTELPENQRGAYDALTAAAGDGKAEGELGRLADLVRQEKDPAAVASVLDRANGAALAVAMSSQMEGNLAHLRRLRQNIGNGQAFDAEGSVSAYINALNDDLKLDADETGERVPAHGVGRTIGH